MSNLQDDERAILARLIPTAHRLQDDLDAFVQWISTLTEQEQSILLARAVRQGQKYTLASIPAYIRPRSLIPSLNSGNLTMTNGARCWSRHHDCAMLEASVVA